jgi:hypothetical protein
MENILLLISLAQRAYSKWLLHRLLLRIIIIVSLVIVISIMMSAAFIVGLYIIYSSLLSSGIEQMVAMLITGISAIALIIILIITLLICLHKLRTMPQTLLKQSTISSLAMDTLNSFITGLMAEQAKKPL